MESGCDPVRRYKNFVMMEQLKEALKEGNRDEALELADMIDQSGIKKRQDLNALAEVFLTNGMLVKAKECLAEIYSRGSSKTVLTKLINLCLKLKEADEAEAYYQEYRRLAPNDYYNYIYRYSIDKMESRPYPRLIATLEKLKKEEYIDTWAYELAKLYHKTGEEQKCIEECSDIIIWFGEGEYVDKARALKAYYTGELNIDELKGREEAADSQEKEQVFDVDAEAAGNEGADEVIESDDFEEDLRLSEADVRTDREAGKKGWNVIEDRELKGDIPDTRPADEPTGKDRTENATTPVDENDRLIMDMLKGEENMLAQMVMDELNREKEQENAQETLRGNSETVRSQDKPSEDKASEPEAEAEPAVRTIDMSDYEFRAVRENPVPEDSFTAKLLNSRGETLEDYFGFFACQDDMRIQLIKALEPLLNPQIRNISVAVTGLRHSGKKSIIKGIVRMLNHAGLLSDTRSAIADAFKVNTVDLWKKREALSGKCLVIDRAGQLTTEAAEGLMKFNEENDGKTAVILCDTRTEMNKLFRNNRDLNSMFPVRVHIPDFDKDDLTEMAAYELKKGGYLIEEPAWELIKKETVKLTKLKKEGSLKATGELVKAAIDRLETRMAKAYIERTMAGEQTVRENVITAEDVEAVIRK